MAKYKNYDYSQSLLIPVSLQEQLMPGTLEFAIHTLVERRMDMSVFDTRYQNDDTGCRAYDPKILLKVVLLAYSRGLISSRQIERACCENVTFMAMSCNQRPDHSTIAAFVSSMKYQIQPLFSDILLVCEQENLLGGTFFAIDGCKLSSNASQECSGKIEDLKKKKEKNENLPPVIEGAKENIQSIGKPEDYFEDKILTADASYHSITNINKCNDEKLDAYIPDNKFRNRDERFSSRLGNQPNSKNFTFADFTYDREQDHYICPNGKRLKKNGKPNLFRGKLLRRYISREIDCRSCKLRAKCLRYKDAKQRHFTYYADESGKNISHEMIKKIESEEGRQIYPRRIAIVEPVFGNIRIHKRMDRLNLRGKIKVNIQWLLYCMVHNIEKVANYGHA